MGFKLPSLPYEYDAMEPYFDAETMKIHHTKHHQAYINNVNLALSKIPEFSNLSIDSLIKKIDDLPEEKKIFIKNNAGGHANHILFWKCLKQGTILKGELKFAIENNFGDFLNFKKKFEKISISHFGSGWVWLVKKENKLDIISTNNQDNPLMGKKITGVYGYPILTLDLWEHSYYLKYKNNRKDYIKAFWNVVNWDEVSWRFFGNEN